MKVKKFFRFFSSKIQDESYLPKAGCHQGDIFFPLVDEALKLGRSIMFCPHGRSMQPTLRDGKDSVVLKAVSQSTILKKYDVVFYKRASGQHVLHRIVKVIPNRGDKNGGFNDGQLFVLCGDGQSDREFGVQRRQILAVLTSFDRGKLHIDCERPSLFYREYVRFWVGIRPLRSVVYTLRNIVRFLARPLYTTGR